MWRKKPGPWSPLPVRLTFVANRPNHRQLRNRPCPHSQNMAPSFLRPGHLLPACGCLLLPPWARRRPICGFGFGGHVAQCPRLVVGGQLFQPRHWSPPTHVLSSRAGLGWIPLWSQDVLFGAFSTDLEIPSPHFKKSSLFLKILQSLPFIPSNPFLTPRGFASSQQTAWLVCWPLGPQSCGCCRPALTPDPWLLSVRKLRIRSLISCSRPFLHLNSAALSLVSADALGCCSDGNNRGRSQNEESGCVLAAGAHHCSHKEMLSTLDIVTQIPLLSSPSAFGSGVRPPAVGST